MAQTSAWATGQVGGVRKGGRQGAFVGEFCGWSPMTPAWKVPLGPRTREKSDT